jgi:hypothetical protein
MRARSDAAKDEPRGEAGIFPALAQKKASSAFRPSGTEVAAFFGRDNWVPMTNQGGSGA